MLAWARVNTGSQFENPVQISCVCQTLICTVQVLTLLSAVGKHLTEFKKSIPILWTSDMCVTVATHMTSVLGSWLPQYPKVSERGALDSNFGNVQRLHSSH